MKLWNMHSQMAHIILNLCLILVAVCSKENITINGLGQDKYKLRTQGSDYIKRSEPGYRKFKNSDQNAVLSEVP